MAIKLKIPPKIKVLEALGSIGDKRIIVLDEKRAKVISSEKDKEYFVYLDLEKNIAFSNDNGTKLRGYIGYPIIAFLMIKKVLPFDEKIANALSQIHWKKLNEKYKNYSVVEKIVKNIAKKRGVEIDFLENFVEEVMRKISNLSLFFDPSLEKNKNEIS
jgi:hypothetical protein